MQLSSRAACTDDEMFGEEEALPLPLLLQGQGAQAPTRDLPLLTQGDLDQGSWRCGSEGWRESEK